MQSPADPTPFLELRDTFDPFLTLLLQALITAAFPDIRGNHRLDWTVAGYHPSWSTQSTCLPSVRDDCLQPPDSSFPSESSWKQALPACENPHRFVLVNFINLSSACQSETPTLPENLRRRLRRDRSWASRWTYPRLTLPLCKMRVKIVLSRHVARQMKCDNSVAAHKKLAACEVTGVSGIEGERGTVFASLA